MTTHATATAAWWIPSNVALARMLLQSSVQTFVLLLPQYNIATSCMFPLSQRGISHLQSNSVGDIGDLGYGFTDGVQVRGPCSPNQKDLNNLIRGLDLAMSNAELLTYRLKQRNLLDESVQVTGQRKRHETFSCLFSQQDGLCFCNSVASLFIGITCDLNEWRLFTDSLSWSLKAVLRHNRNRNSYLSLPVAHSVHLKEDYTSAKVLLNALKYDKYGWEVIGDLKMVSFLVGIPDCVTKFPCLLCLWGSCDTMAYYHRKDWTQWAEFCVGKSNNKWEPLTEHQKVLMPALNNKLDLIKQFVTALTRSWQLSSTSRIFFQSCPRQRSRLEFSENRR